jgi:hypothetical protein
MLSPDDIDLAGDKVAVVYTQIESEMLDYLVDQLLDGNILDQKSTTALTLLAQTHAPKLREIIANNQDAIDQAALETVTEYLKMSDADDIARLGEGAPMWPQQVEATVAGISQVLARNNLRMAEGAKQAFLNASIEAVTQVNTGNKTTEKALHTAVRNLERNGISVVNYQNAATGIRTVTNAVDVAVRRHIRTQIAQDGARMTLERLNDMDVALVEVSSHEGARPTHAVWQGRCYSLHGTVKIDGVTYNDFYTSTNYGAVDGLLGANCRHSFGPYKHGAKRFYSPDPKHPSGLSNDEVYNLTQKQRYYERQIRAAKRELRGAQQIYNKQGGIEALTELSKAKDKLAKRQSAMRTFIEESNAKCKKGTSVLTRHPNREWAGDMPKVTSKKILAEEQKISKKNKSNNFSVKRKVVNGAAYKERFNETGIPKRAAQTAHQQALRILEDRDGTASERMCAISWKTGRLIADTFKHEPQDARCWFGPEETEVINKVNEGVVIIHNHPGNSAPSLADIKAAAINPVVKASLVTCHDGTIYSLKINKREVVEEIAKVQNRIKTEYNQVSDSSLIDEIAYTTIIKKNEVERWFKINKI